MRNNLRGGVAKSPTGIKGLDEITLGGLPTGRPTLICGSAGCGKTLFGMEFLVRGVQFGEAGVCVTFEERVEDVIANVASLGFDLPTLIAAKKLSLDHVELDRTMPDRQGYCAAGRLSRSRRRAHRLRPAGARGPRRGRGAAAALRDRATRASR